MRMPYHAFIWIRSFSVDAAIVLDILKCLIHDSALTSVVPILGGAVNQILFAQ